MLSTLALAVLLCGCALAPAVVVPQDNAGAAEGGSSFVTLGTYAGQVPSPVRSQPANLLRYGDQTILIDAGDGASGQLAKAGVSLGVVDSVFISHLHYDHTGGLYAFLGLRRVTRPGRLTIYGPIGTQRMVDSLVAAADPPGGLTGPGRGSARALDAGIDVIELGDNSVVDLEGARVIVATNTHYTFEPGSEEAGRFQSLSFRFELPDRIIAYTGDTGPSKNVERLIRGADLLVAEISDPEGLISAAQKAGRVFAPPALKLFDHHMRNEHLIPEAVGELASAGEVKRLVISHIGIGDRTIEETLPRIAAHYSGPIIFANDMESF